MRLAAGLAAVFLAGCEYGPEHLDALYFQRDHFQRLIDGVEARNELASRDKPKREAVLAAVEDERRARAEREKLYQEWLKSLTPEQRFQWMMKQEELSVLRARTGTGEWMHIEEMEALERERRRKIIYGDQQRVDGNVDQH
jgi:outer membrane PBP1 activator LpoA protein